MLLTSVLYQRMLSGFEEHLHALLPVFAQDKLASPPSADSNRITIILGHLLSSEIQFELFLRGRGQRLCRR